MIDEIILMCNYSILWVTPTHKFIYYGEDSLEGLVAIVERWYQKCPRDRRHPKIICNKTGEIVYE